MTLKLTPEDPPAPRKRRRSKRKRPRRRYRVARRGIEVLPTTLTLGNLLCGFGAIFIAAQSATLNMPFDASPMVVAALLIFVGMLFDGLDGGVARLTDSTSPLGAQLDSFADMVTFGVAPALLVVQLVGVDSPFGSGDNTLAVYADRLALAVAGIYVACAGLRLARFNLEQLEPYGGRPSTLFTGLPTPGAAGAIGSLILLHGSFLDDASVPGWVVQAVAGFMLFITFLAGVLMVSTVPYVHVTKRYIRKRASWQAVATAVFVVMLSLVNLQLVLAAGFSAYALSGPFNLARARLKRGLAPTPPSTRQQGDPDENAA